MSGRGWLLDVACGTGEIAFALAGYFDEVLAIDQEPESIEFARAKAEAAGVSNTTWVMASTEPLLRTERERQAWHDERREKDRQEPLSAASE